MNIYKILIISLFVVISAFDVKSQSVEHKFLKTENGFDISKLPEPDSVYIVGVDQDWLVKKVDLPAGIFKGENNKEIIISNGLISRTFRIVPNCATVDFVNLVNGETLIRGVRPEALITLNGKEYQIGGLDGQIEYGYLKREWLDGMTNPENSFQLTEIETIDTITPRIDWKNRRWSRIKKGPVKGKSLVFTYKHKKFPGLTVKIHYNIYDGIPLISKWMTVTNNGDKDLNIDEYVSEVLAFVEAESAVNKDKGWHTPNIHIESDYEFNAMNMEYANKVVNWEKDDKYTSQVNYAMGTPCLLECKLPIGPDETLNPGETYESFRVWELPYDSYDRQRKGLYTNKMYEVISPWVTENPMFLHLTSSKPSKVKAAIDQCAETGYEMVILSFGSGLNMEDTSERNISKYKKLADYAHSKGIELGGYSLLSSRSISPEVE